jgi:hypothetical protein
MPTYVGPAGERELLGMSRDRQNFEEQRQECWSTLLRRPDLACTSDDLVILPIVQRLLGGNAELALKAYQLHVASVTIGVHAYVPPADGRAFANQLYAEVCGTTLSQALHLVQLLHPPVGWVSSYRELEETTLARMLTDPIGHGFAASLPSLRLLRGSRPANLVGLYMDLVSSPQFLEKHEVIPPFDPHAGPNGQDHLAPVLQRQYHRAFA